MPNMQEFKFDVFTLIKLVELISLYAKDNCFFAKDLQKSSSDPVAINSDVEAQIKSDTPEINRVFNYRDLCQ